MKIYLVVPCCSIKNENLTYMCIFLPSWFFLILVAYRFQKMVFLSPGLVFYSSYLILVIALAKSIERDVHKSIFLRFSDFTIRHKFNCRINR